jgi:hypothetical protein
MKFLLSNILDYELSDGYGNDEKAFSGRKGTDDKNSLSPLFEQSSLIISWSPIFTSVSPLELILPLECP